MTNEEWSRWYTPVYVVGGWGWRKRGIIGKSEKLLEETREKAETEVVLPTAEKTIQAIKAYEQLNLFE